MWLWRKREEPQTAQTPYGEFVKHSGEKTWEGFVEIGDTEVQVLADDTDGQPNPELLKWLPFISEHLVRLEDTAREAVPQLSPQHFFGLVTESNEGSDFSLGFNYSEENWGETVYVDFKDGAVTGWSSAD